MRIVPSLLFASLVPVAFSIDTVDVNLTMYVGRWYQMYGDRAVFDTFERNAVCATADYSLNDDGTVHVFNNEQVGGIDGPFSNATATASATDNPGQFTVVFDGGAPFPAPYWVVALGPVVDDEYQYAIVTDNLQAGLFVLARDVANFNLQYDSEVQDLLKDLGFTNYINEPIAMLQEGCTYADPSETLSSTSRFNGAVPQHCESIHVGSSPCLDLCAPPSVAGGLALIPGMKRGSCVEAAMKDSNCAVVSPLADVDLDAYISATWYIQQQQVTGYQDEDEFFCVAATYRQEGASVPFFSGDVISVYNYANKNQVNGEATNTANGTVLCAREEDESTPGSLAVAPCFLPNALAGPYWIVALGYTDSGDLSWAAVSGGQPTEEYDDGCTTKLEGTNNSGLWILSRSPVAADEDIEAARSALSDLGFTLSQLQAVEQNGCSYEGALIV